MALHTRKDFALLCGVDQTYVAVNIGRKKIIIQGKYIDDQVSENKKFLFKRTGSSTPDMSRLNKPFEPELIPVPVAIPEKETTKLRRGSSPKDPLVVPERGPLDPINVPERSGQDTEDAYKNNLEINKKRLEIEKLIEDIEIKRIQKQKLNGEVIPTELVKSLYTQHFKSITNTFKNAVDNFLVDISQKHKITSKDMAGYKGLLIDVVNMAVKEAVVESKKNIKSVVAEYSQKLGKGQKKV